MKREVLINKVKTRIDEISQNSELLIDIEMSDNAPYDVMITEHLDESARDVLLVFPIYRLDVEHLTNVNMVGGVITLPTNYLRFVKIKLLNWQRDVTELVDPSSVTAKRQSNKYLKAGYVKPVAVLDTQSGGNIIKPYPNDSTVEYLSYIKDKRAEEITNPQMIDALCWICASKVLAIMGRNSLAEQANNMAKGLML